MEENKLLELLNKVKNNECSVEEAMDKIKNISFINLDFAKLDTNRKLRQGFSEAVYCPGKTPDQIINIILELKKHNSIILATRASDDVAKYVIENIPEATYDHEAKMIILGDLPKEQTTNNVLVITAGTVDIPVAKEAILTIKSNGVKVKTIYDCGVAGIHRLFEHLELIQQASAIIVIAGMEGALASVVGGISACPVIAVPTSNGYGANFDGLAPLLSMLNSCASCVSVVNIDNGYGAGIIASLIVKQSKELT